MAKQQMTNNDAASVSSQAGASTGTPSAPKTGVPGTDRPETGVSKTYISETDITDIPETAAPVASVVPAAPAAQTVPADWAQQLAAKDEAYRRALADYQNLQRRSAQEKTQLMAAAAQVVLADLLPTLDHLQLAAQHIADPSLNMIVTDLTRSLEHHGLEKITTVGQPFDPAVMEAVDVQTDGSTADNTVIAEQRAGYKCRGQLLRPAQVVVSKQSD